MTSPDDAVAVRAASPRVGTPRPYVALRPRPWSPMWSRGDDVRRRVHRAPAVCGDAHVVALGDVTDAARSAEDVGGVGEPVRRDEPVLAPERQRRTRHRRHDATLGDHRPVAAVTVRHDKAAVQRQGADHGSSAEAVAEGVPAAPETVTPGVAAVGARCRRGRSARGQGQLVGGVVAAPGEGHTGGHPHHQRDGGDEGQHAPAGSRGQAPGVVPGLDGVGHVVPLDARRARSLMRVHQREEPVSRPPTPTTVAGPRRTCCPGRARTRP